MHHNWKSILAAGIACAISAGVVSAEPRNLRVATTSPGSPWNILGVQVGDAMRQKYEDLRTSSVSIGGSMANIVAVSKGEAQLAWSIDATVEEAWAGIGQFPAKIQNIRLVGPFAAVALQIQARADSDLKSVEDLKTASIAVGGPGWTSTNMNEAVVTSLGFDYDTINASGGQVHLVGHADWPPMLQDRVADAILHWGGIPSGTTSAMVENPGIRVLGFTDEQVEKIRSTEIFSHSYAVPVTLEGGLYEGIPDEGVKTLAWMSMAVVNEDMDDEMVYDITKALFDGLITGVYKDGISGSFDSVKAVAEMTSVPFHPGAARYFAEHGVTVNTQ